MEMMIMKQQKKKKGRSVQELLGIKTFTKYGLATKSRKLQSHRLAVAFKFCG
jgi:hypothetical protein